MDDPAAKGTWLAWGVGLRDAWDMNNPDDPNKTAALRCADLLGWLAEFGEFYPRVRSDI